MEVHFVLDSVEEAQKIELMTRSEDMFNVLWDMNQHMRNTEKYELEYNIESLRKYFRELLFDSGINLDHLNSLFCDSEEEDIEVE